MFTTGDAVQYLALHLTEEALKIDERLSALGFGTWSAWDAATAPTREPIMFLDMMDTHVPRRLRPGASAGS